MISYFYLFKTVLTNKIMVFHVLSLDNKYYKIEKENTESNDEFFHRCWFIAKKNPSIKNFEDTIALSKISRNVKFLDVKYNENIMKMLTL